MSARVLIIEDNQTNLELLMYLLRAYGHTVLTARDGASGISAVRALRPDLVACDVQLPGIDGYELARRIKADPDLASIPLVAVTALAMPGDRDKALSAGFDGYIAKPIAPDRLIENLESYLRVEKRSSGRPGHHPPAPRPREAAGRDTQPPDHPEPRAAGHNGGAAAGKPPGARREGV